MCTHMWEYNTVTGDVYAHVGMQYRYSRCVRTCWKKIRNMQLLMFFFLIFISFYLSSTALASIISKFTPDLYLYKKPLNAETSPTLQQIAKLFFIIHQLFTISVMFFKFIHSFITNGNVPFCHTYVDVNILSFSVPYGICLHQINLKRTFRIFSLDNLREQFTQNRNHLKQINPRWCIFCFRIRSCGCI